MKIAKEFLLAEMADEYKIKYRITPQTEISDVSEIKVYKDNETIGVLSVSTLGKPASSGYVQINEKLDLSGNYRISP